MAGIVRFPRTVKTRENALCRVGGVFGGVRAIPSPPCVFNGGLTGFLALFKLGDPPAVRAGGVFDPVNRATRARPARGSAPLLTDRGRRADWWRLPALALLRRFDGRSVELVDQLSTSCHQITHCRREHVLAVREIVSQIGKLVEDRVTVTLVRGRRGRLRVAGINRHHVILWVIDIPEATVEEESVANSDREQVEERWLPLASEHLGVVALDPHGERQLDGEDRIEKRDRLEREKEIRINQGVTCDLKLIAHRLGHSGQQFDALRAGVQMIESQIPVSISNVRLCDLAKRFEFFHAGPECGETKRAAQVVRHSPRSKRRAFETTRPSNRTGDFPVVRTARPF